jgi:hypothetical protein
MTKPVPWKYLKMEDLGQIAPLKDGRPDMFNYMPSRFITKDEAAYRKWKHFYIGETCRWGHMAPRYVINGKCIDCQRVTEGRDPIGGKGTAEYVGKQSVYKQRDKSITTAKPAEPDSLEKRFIVEYVKTKSFAQAAQICGRTEAEFLGRLSYDKVFREAVNRLEEENGLSRTASLTETYEWDDDKRRVLMHTYINTGDLAAAMRSVGVSNFYFTKELEENPVFREDMEKAQVMGLEQLERNAISLAVTGKSDKLLPMVMKAKLPDYRDSVKVDMNVTQKLTPGQINEQFGQLLLELIESGETLSLPAPSVDAEFSESSSADPAEDAGSGQEASQPSPQESNLDLV